MSKSPGPKFITDVAITYTPASQDGYTRFAKLSAPSFLWYGCDPHLAPIVSVCVCYDDETPDKAPEDAFSSSALPPSSSSSSSSPASPVKLEWLKIAEDVNKNLPNRRVHLFVAHQPQTDTDTPVQDAVASSSSSSSSPSSSAASCPPPILELRTISGQQAVPEGFVKVGRDITRAPSNSAAEQCFIVVKFHSDVKKEGWEAGDFLDVLDTVQKWCVARVVRVTDSGYLIHFEGWSDKYDEEISDLNRLAPHRTHTFGDTGPNTNANAYKMRGEQLTQFRSVLARLVAIRQKYLALVVDGNGNASGKSQAASASSSASPAVEWLADDRKFVMGENVQMVSNCLNAVIDDVEAVPQVNQFLQYNLDLAIYSLKSDDPPVVEWINNMCRILGEGEHRFYTKYGCQGTEKGVDGKFAVRGKPVKRGNDLVMTSSFLFKTSITSATKAVSMPWRSFCVASPTPACCCLPRKKARITRAPLPRGPRLYLRRHQ